MTKVFSKDNEIRLYGFCSHNAIRSNLWPPHLLLNRIVSLAEVLQELVVGMLYIITWLLAIHKGQGTQSELQSLRHGSKPLPMEDFSNATSSKILRQTLKLSTLGVLVFSSLVAALQKRKTSASGSRLQHCHPTLTYALHMSKWHTNNDCDATIQIASYLT